MTYIKRAIESVIQQSTRDFPVVVLTGPRQSGKTTLLKHVFGNSHAYVSLEPPDVQAAAITDPRGFLAVHAPPVIMDEIQYAPALLPYIKEWVDSHRAASGQYLLTGSQNLLLLEKVSESLAGRAAVLHLLPLSLREQVGDIDVPFPWETDSPRSIHRDITYNRLWNCLLYTSPSPRDS